MKKQILEELRVKFTGVSDSVLSRIAEKLAKTATKEEDVAAVIEGVTFQQVLESYGDSRATEATQTAVANYEKKHSLKEGKPATGGEQEKEEAPEGNEATSGGDIASQIAAAVSAAIRPLQTEIETLRVSKISDTRKQQLEDIVGNASEKFKNRILKNYERMNFKDDADYEEFLSEIKKEAEDDISEVKHGGGILGIPPYGGKLTKKEPTKEETEAVLAGLY